jgi:site-specific recombinase XerD
MAVTYHLYQRKDKARENGEAPIYLRITENRKSRFLTTGVYLNPTHWNEDKEVVRRSHRTYKSLNSILDSKLDKAKEIQADLSSHGKDSAKAIQHRLKKQQSGDFFDLADVYLKEVKQNQSYYTHKNSKVAIGKVEAFEGERVLPLNHLDTDYLERFVGFLKRKYDNKPNTINKNFRAIRGIIKKALKNHLITIDPFVNFEGAKRAKAKPKTKLSIKQIQALKDFDLEKGSNHWHTRNYFMFSFYSGGIRFGDLCCLKWSDIKENRLSYQMNKNDKVFTIELNDYQQEILEHYEENKKPNGFIFPLLNNHKDYSDPTYLRKRIGSNNTLINNWLKKLSKRVNKKLKKDRSDVPPIEGISFHVARHSFAQHAVEKGLSMYELMQTLRHSKIETTEKYLKGLDEQLADKAMKKVF